MENTISLPITTWLYDLTTNQPIININANLQRHIASLSKIMTAMVVLDSNIDLTLSVKLIGAKLQPWTENQNTLIVGEYYTIHELLIALLLPSNNAAATTLAEDYAGGYCKFVESMNTKAQLLGMADTKFVDPTGADHGNMSTAKDIHMMLIETKNYPVLQDISIMDSYNLTRNATVLSLRNMLNYHRHKILDINFAKTAKDKEAKQGIGMLFGVDSLSKNQYTAVVLGEADTPTLRISLEKMKKLIHIRREKQNYT